MVRRGEKCPTCGRRYAREIAVDAVAIRRRRIVLIKRGRPPDRGKWALPGGLLDWDESVEEAVLRELTEETGLVGALGRLVGVYSDPTRSLEQRVTIVYEVVIRGGVLTAGGDARDARWFSLRRLPALAADHRTIIEDSSSILGSPHD